MQYINFLNCSGNITSCCTSPEVSAIMTPIRNLYSIIQIIAPILLMCAATYRLIRLMKNPEEKNGIKVIINSFLAAAIIFFIPTIVSAILNMVSSQGQLSACWESAGENKRLAIASSYISNSEDKRVKVVSEGDYEAGVKKPVVSDGSSSDGSSGGSSSGGDYSGSATPSEAGPLTNVKYLEGGMPIPLYYQQDYKDVSLRPGTSKTVSSSGCGFTSCAMIVSYLLDKKITPREFVGDWSRKYYVYNQGMSWGLPQAAATHYGLGSVESTTSSKRMVEALRNNQPVMSSQSAGLFTSGGHLIVLRGVTADGKILVNDPNRGNAVGKNYNSRKFTVAEIERSNKKYFIFPKKK